MGCCRVGPILTTVFPEITRTGEAPYVRGRSVDRSVDRIVDRSVDRIVDRAMSHLMCRAIKKASIR
jgi:hypothetical protein